MNAPTFVNWGGGVDSTGMVVEMVRRGEAPDLVIFADVEAEEPHTYEFAKTFDAWLRDRGLELTVVRGGGKYGSLENRCRVLATLPSIAMGWKTCSTTYKRDPIDKFITSWGPYQVAKSLGVRCVKILGYDAGEAHRAKTPKDSRYDYRYPLIEWGWDRAAAAAAIASAGLPDPGKSACFFCPSSKKPEILELRRRYPDLFARALEMEDRARPNISIAGLGRYFSWREFVEEYDRRVASCEAPRQLSLLLEGPETDAPCDCYDGA